ncbi:amidase [Streptomyces sp. NPDC002870]|uniref:amidase n=1 Tax=Streptomyces sp. NPDC002870 TaxID=3364666 RepID=UPI00368DE386
MEDLVLPTSVASVSESLRAGETDPKEYMERTCARIARVDGTVQAFVAEPGRADRLRDAARELSTRGAEPGERPALYGVPVGLKDIVHVNGLPTRAGSALPPEVLRGEQATVVDRLLRAGALIAGKTVTSEFAVAAPGPTRNPHRPEHTPGGSSSGSAAAVAAGMVPLAIGTQTIGSLIRPAAYCGVVGFKPSHGRIPLDGVVPTSPTYDTLGTLTAKVADAALAAACLCDDWQPARAVPGRPVLGIPDGPYLGFAEPEALAAFDEQVVALRTAGYDVVRVPMFEDFEEDAFQLFVVNLYELARSHAEWFARFEKLYDERTAEAVRQGQSAGDSDYAKALEQRDDFRDRLEAATGRHGVDLWITPSATGPAPFGLDSAGDSVMSLPWSGAGLPCLSIPTARPPAALPLGLQCVARFGDDERLLSWALELERVLSA